MKTDFLDCRGGIPDAYGRNRLVLSIWPGHVVPVCALCAGQSLGDGVPDLFCHRHDPGKEILVALDVAEPEYLMMAGALYTSYYAYGVEQGTVISSCTMGAGFPEFMPLDQWMPVLFEAQGMCGQSPPMPLGVSMVEALLITLSAPLLVLVALWGAHVQKIAAGEVQ